MSWELKSGTEAPKARETDLWLNSSFNFFSTSSFEVCNVLLSKSKRIEVVSKSRFRFYMTLSPKVTSVINLRTYTSVYL